MPAGFAASGIHYQFALSWRPYLDYFEWGAAAFGLACCIVAPFIVKVPVAKNILLCAVAFAIYVFDLFVSAFVSVLVFGFG